MLCLMRSLLGEDDGAILAEAQARGEGLSGPALQPAAVNPASTAAKRSRFDGLPLLQQWQGDNQVFAHMQHPAVAVVLFPDTGLVGSTQHQPCSYSCRP